ncbi:hypothetical protein ALT785_390178 [Alteromonas infernus]
MYSTFNINTIHKLNIVESVKLCGANFKVVMCVTLVACYR